MSLTLPNPPGPFAVGSARIQVDDETDKESPDHVMLHFRYPTLHANTVTRALYIPSETARQLEQTYTLPEGAFDWVRTNSFKDADIACPFLSPHRSLPVIVFSPGLGSPEGLYTVFQEALASWGYIVVGVEHPLGRPPSDASPSGSADETIRRAKSIHSIVKQFTPQKMATWIPGFEEATRSQNLRGMTVGMFGHSLGGAATALAMQDPSVVQAGCSLDGPLYGPVLTTGFPGPFLFQLATAHLGNYSTLQSVWPRIRGWKRAIAIKSAAHNDFSDIAILASLAPELGIAQIFRGRLAASNPLQTLLAVGENLRDFFDFALRGIGDVNFLRENTTLQFTASI
ncbi:hypothetical protein BDV23DRAFT_188713 [Aspergillus alliaceus]|nr:hypothetical protein BDV23DRAFT_188713 [Aspergillus alliaceus]